MSGEKAKVMLDNFLRRDAEAVDRFNNQMTYPGSREHIDLIDGRVRDLAAICIYLLKLEAEREALK